MPGLPRAQVAGAQRPGGVAAAQLPGVDPHGGPHELVRRDVGHAGAARHAMHGRVHVRAAVLGEVEIAGPVALLVVRVRAVRAERHRARPEERALAERLGEVEDPHADESNGRSNRVDRTICVCVRVTPGWSRIRSSASSRCDVSRARTQTQIVLSTLFERPFDSSA